MLLAIVMIGCCIRVRGSFIDRRTARGIDAQADDRQGQGNQDGDFARADIARTDGITVPVLAMDFGGLERAADDAGGHVQHVNRAENNSQRRQSSELMPRYGEVNAPKSSEIR